MSAGRPWFKFFPAEWLGSRETRFLTPEGRGYLIQLLAEAWQSEPCGTLPADPEQLWKLAGAPSRKRFDAHSSRVLVSFSLQGDRYVSPQLVALYNDMEAVAGERRIAGTLGAKKRWQTDSKRLANAIGSSWQTHGDIEEMRRERDVNSDSDAEVEPQGRTAGRSQSQEPLRARTMGNLAGLTKAVIEDKQMPTPMSAEECQARRQLLKAQAGSRLH